MNNPTIFMNDKFYKYSSDLGLQSHNYIKLDCVLDQAKVELSCHLGWGFDNLLKKYFSLKIFPELRTTI